MVGFKLTRLETKAFEKYNNFTLSVMHTLDISDTDQQRAQIMMGADDPLNHLIDQSTGKQPRKQWVHTLAKTALPNGASGPYQPLFKLVAPLAAGGVAQGWQIESIAVLGNQ